VRSTTQWQLGIRPPNYNVAPTTDILAVVARHDEPDRRAGAQRPGIGVDDPATRRIRLMRWACCPPWTKPGPDGGLPVKGPQPDSTPAPRP